MINQGSTTYGSLPRPFSERFHMLLYLMLLLCPVQSALALAEDDTKLIGSVEYRCGDGSLSEPIDIFAPHTAISQLSCETIRSKAKQDEFIIYAGNTYFPPADSKRPFRRAEQACRFRKGIAFTGHKVNGQALAAILIHDPRNCAE